MAEGNNNEEVIHFNNFHCHRGQDWSPQLLSNMMKRTWMMMSSWRKHTNLRHHDPISSNQLPSGKISKDWEKKGLKYLEQPLNQIRMAIFPCITAHCLVLGHRMILRMTTVNF